MAMAAACFARPASAQLTDLVEIAGTYAAPVVLDAPEPTATQLSSYDIAVNVPVPVAQRSFLIGGIAYHVDAVAYDRGSPQLDSLRSFHAVDANLLFVQLLPRDWSLALRLSAGLAGDFESVDPGLFRWSFMGLATNAVSSRLTLGAGALAMWSFGTLLPLPALYLDWHPNERWQLEAFFPAFLRLTYTHARRIELGARAEVSGQSYAVRDSRIAGSWRCRPVTDDPSTSLDESRPLRGSCVDHVTYSQATAGLHLGLRLFATVWLTTLVGGTFSRRIESHNARDDLTPGGAQALPGSFLFRAALTWRLPTGSDDPSG